MTPLALPVQRGIPKTASVAPSEVRNKSLKMVEEHGRAERAQAGGLRRHRPEAGQIVEESEDDLLDNEDSRLGRQEEEAPWIEKIADDRQYRQVMSDVLERYSVMTDRELEKGNRMMQHRIKCKAQRRNQGVTDLCISKAVLLGKRI